MNWVERDAAVVWHGFTQIECYAENTLDGASIHWVRRIAPDEVWLIADAGLNTINAINLCMHLLEPKRTRVFLNRFDTTNQLHCLNAEWLKRHEALTIVTTLEALL